jgi:hypothetical protein
VEYCPVPVQSRCPFVPVFFGFLLAVSGLSSSPASAGRWFDLGTRQPVTIEAETDSTCLEMFPPDAFGIFPTGSWVWEEMRELTCGEVRWPDQVCWQGQFVRGVRVEFDDAACGCGGWLELPSQVTLTYSDHDFIPRGISEPGLKIVYNDRFSHAWQEVPGPVTHDPDLNRFTVTWKSDILKVRQFAIVTSAFVPTLPTTWGRLKALYGR